MPATRRGFLGAALKTAGAAWGAGINCTRPNTGKSLDLFDVLVYGATPAGIASALAAARGGCRVLLAEPSAHLGGLVASGLSHTDFRTFESLTGIYLEFTQRVLAHYEDTYGKDSPQARECMRGTQAEPKVNRLVFERMLGAQPAIRLMQGLNLADVAIDGNAGAPALRAAIFTGPASSRYPVAARVFVDATYEGDLMAAANVPFRVGRESRQEYGESLAPDQADSQLQGYNFRLIATREPANRVPPSRPDGYRRQDYDAVLPLLRDGRLQGVFGFPSDYIYKAQIPSLPNGKFDLNDVSHSAVRLSLPGENLGWPEGDHAARDKIFACHLRWNTGLLWFLQNDPAVPAKFQQEARGWGWCRDEFAGTGHLPPQLYVREARRMVGQRIFTQADSAHAAGDARAVPQRDSIATGDYGNNCHGTAHEGPRIGGKHTGEFYQPVPPYQIPYATLLPHDVTNLLVPVAASSSHVGFCALRLEPIWTSLGEAAGVAAALAVQAHGASQDRQPPPAPRNASSIPAGSMRKLAASDIQRTLWKQGSATVYVSDVPPLHPDFAAVQWWATLGGLHGLAATPALAELRGKHITGQYFEAFPHHAAALNRALDPHIHQRWMGLATDLGVNTRSLPATGTRGEWIRAAFRSTSQR